ncbi:MAG TPA: anthranilate phosphoribosyltransferase [Methanomassiliicoccales archaeon]|nr:anthranilate phosphoribosyltransferase [Methanomassiliicoccales archaeon]
MLEQKLKQFGIKVDALLKGKDLTREETTEMFREVLLDEQPDLQQGAFLAAITAKRVTPEELAGAWEAIYEFDTVKVKPQVDGPLVDNCGTGMDALKTFNISTAASLIAAADGVILAKHGARAITSRCGVVDILEELGVDVDCDIEIVKRSIESAGIGIFNGNSPKVHPTALFRILSKIRFGTILNIAGSLANPAAPTYGVRGVYSIELINPVIETMKEIGYQRAIVFHGLNKDGTLGMDEVSTLGQTKVVELSPDGKIQSYDLHPKDFGIERSREEDLLCSFEKSEEALQFIKILGGHTRGSRRDIVCLNAAPILYMMGRSKSWEDGFYRANELIDSGVVIDKLKDWVRAQNTVPERGEQKLDELIKRASD